MSDVSGEKVGVMEVDVSEAVVGIREGEGASPGGGGGSPRGPSSTSPPGKLTPPTPEGEEGDAVNGKEKNLKKKHRRGKHKGGRHHRKWRPYTQLSWDEREAVDARETQRACLKREQRMASGQPMAPYNTTQFLMEQHQPQDADFHLDETTGGGGGGGGGGGHHHSHSHARDGGRTRGEGSGSLDSSDELYDSAEDEEIFLEKDFTEAYQNFHAERLQTMDKDELVREYLELEGKVERLEGRLKEVAGCRSRRTGSSAGSPGRPGIGAEQAVDIGQAVSLEAEVRRLREANARLSTENERLKSSIEGASNSC